MSFTFNRETTAASLEMVWNEQCTTPTWMFERLLSGLVSRVTYLKQMLVNSWIRAVKHTHFPSHVSNLSGSVSYFNTTASPEKHQNCPPVKSENSQCRVKRKAGDQYECFLFHKSPGWKSVRKTWKLRVRSIQVVSQALTGKYKYCFKVVFSSGVLKCVPACTGR